MADEEVYRVLREDGGLPSNLSRQATLEMWRAAVRKRHPEFAYNDDDLDSLIVQRIRSELPEGIGPIPPLTPEGQVVGESNLTPSSLPAGMGAGAYHPRRKREGLWQASPYVASLAAKQEAMMDELTYRPDPVGEAFVAFLDGDGPMMADAIAAIPPESLDRFRAMVREKVAETPEATTTWDKFKEHGARFMWGTEPLRKRAEAVLAASDPQLKRVSPMSTRSHLWGEKPDPVGEARRDAFYSHGVSVATTTLPPSAAVGPLGSALASLPKTPFPLSSAILKNRAWAVLADHLLKNKLSVPRIIQKAAESLQRGQEAIGPGPEGWDIPRRAISESASVAGKILAAPQVAQNALVSGGPDLAIDALFHPGDYWTMPPEDFMLIASGRKNKLGRFGDKKWQYLDKSGPIQDAVNTIITGFGLAPENRARPGRALAKGLMIGVDPLLVIGGVNEMAKFARMAPEQRAAMWAILRNRGIGRVDALNYTSHNIPFTSVIREGVDEVATLRYQPSKEFKPVVDLVRELALEHTGLMNLDVAWEGAEVGADLAFVQGRKPRSAFQSLFAAAKQIAEVSASTAGKAVGVKDFDPGVFLASLGKNDELAQTHAWLIARAIAKGWDPEEFSKLYDGAMKEMLGQRDELRATLFEQKYGLPPAKGGPAPEEPPPPAPTPSPKSGPEQPPAGELRPVRMGDLANDVNDFIKREGRGHYPGSPLTAEGSPEELNALLKPGATVYQAKDPETGRWRIVDENGMSLVPGDKDFGSTTDLHAYAADKSWTIYHAPKEKAPKPGLDRSGAIEGEPPIAPSVEPPPAVVEEPRPHTPTESAALPEGPAQADVVVAPPNINTEANAAELDKFFAEVVPHRPVQPWEVSMWDSPLSPEEHRSMLEDALKRGRRVPPEVMADYPDLHYADSGLERMAGPAAEAQADYDEALAAYQRTLEGYRGLNRGTKERKALEGALYYKYSEVLKQRSKLAEVGAQAIPELSTVEAEATLWRSLPADLARGTPQVKVGNRTIALKFESDRDRALYALSTKLSPVRQADYHSWVTGLGFNEYEIEKYASEVRGRVFQMAHAEAEAKKLTIPAGTIRPVGVE